MSYSVTQLKADLTGALHGTTLNQITGLDNLIYRAARQVLLDVDPQETKRIVQFANPIFTDVYDYAVPSDLKGNRVIDIRPQVNRQLRDIYTQTYNQPFDVNKILNNQNQFTVQYNTGIKTIRVEAPFLTPGITINEADVVVRNGTWVVGGTASNLTTDNVNFASGSGSLKFDLAAGGAGSVGYLENSTMSAVNLTNHLNQATEFLFSYFPTASNFNNVKLRWGTDAANYYELTFTTTFEATAFQNGFNLLGKPWLGATVVGVPTITNIKYARVSWTYDGTAQTGVRLDNIVSRLGSILELEYYSKFLFRDSSTGVFQETVTDDSNIINLDTESYNLMFFQVAYLATQQQQGKNALQYDGQFTLKGYQQAVQRYQAMYKSEVQKPRQVYYQQPNSSYTQWISGNSWPSP